MERVSAHSIVEAYRNRWTLLLYYGIRIAMLVAVAVFAFERDWASAAVTVFIFALMATPAVLKHRYRVYLPFAIELGIVVFVFATLFLGHIANFYDHVPFWDKFLHLQSGLLLGASGFVLVYTLNREESLHLSLSPGFVAFFAVTFSLAIGAVWEMLEFAGDYVFTSAWQHSNTDTMWDIIADGTGALLVSVYGYLWMRREARLPFTPRVFRFFREKAKRALLRDRLR